LSVSGEKPREGVLQEIWATDRATWRAWLEKHHATETGVWLLYWKKSSGKQGLDWSEAVDEALCFGWIDSTRRTLDEQSFKQYFAPRKSRSNWSGINKAKVERLIAEGRMAPAGLAAVERAKANGSWHNLDDVEANVVPSDLLAALDATPGAREYFDGLSRMKRWEILYWISGAKRETTRADRIRQIVEAAAEGKRPDRFRP
jgi:uncharacterized protein YdeI (YjbR/CyaY-like superfamily)